MLLLDLNHIQVDTVYRSGAKASTNHQFQALCSDEMEPDATTEGLIIEEGTTEDPLALCDTSQKLELEDFLVDMKVKRYGQEPGETEGLASVSWTHSLACVSTYGIHLCDEEICWKGIVEARSLGATLEQDLGALVLPDKLQQCSRYTLTILPTDKVTNRTMSSFDSVSMFIFQPLREEQESPLSAGFSQEFTFIPGLSPPQVYIY